MCHAVRSCVLSETSDNDDPDHKPEPLTLDAWHRAQGARMVEFAGYAEKLRQPGESKFCMRP